MAQQGGGIPGVAVAMATAGAFLLYIGINDVSIRDGLKAVSGGQLPSRKPAGGEAVARAEASLRGGAAGGSSSPAAGAVGVGANAKLATAALKYKGLPYRLGGVSRTKGMDCSGLVVIAFEDAYGVTPPRTTYVQVVWKALKPISRSDVAAGDLLFWPKVGPPGHVGIAISNAEVVHAPRTGKRVEVVPINRAYTGGAAPSCFRYVGGK